MFIKQVKKHVKGNRSSDEVNIAVTKYVSKLMNR